VVFHYGTSTSYSFSRSRNPTSTEVIGLADDVTTKFICISTFLEGRCLPRRMNVGFCRPAGRRKNRQLVERRTRAWLCLHCTTILQTPYLISLLAWGEMEDHGLPMRRPFRLPAMRTSCRHAQTTCIFNIGRGVACCMLCHVQRIHYFLPNATRLGQRAER
jgi:hypothetical protein